MKELRAHKRVKIIPRAFAMGSRGMGIRSSESLGLETDYIIERGQPFLLALRNSEAGPFIGNH
jgi:hypothetical protein